MGTDGPPSLATLGARSSSQIPTTLSIDVSAAVNNMKVANPLDCSVAPAVADHTPHPRTPSLQADDARLIEGKSTFKTNAYFRADVIKPGAYSRYLIRSACGNMQKPKCPD